MRIAIAQLNPVVGDITGNLEKILGTVESAADEKPDLIVFPELVLTGYPPRDLLERRWLLKGARSAADRIAYETAGGGCGIILGLPTPTGRDIGRGLYNSAVLIHDGAIRFSQHKQLLPTYDVFDEDRYFDSAAASEIVEFKGERLGISICEDAWNDPELWRKRIYNRDPIEELAGKGATLMINISASPYYIGKEQIRRRIIQNHARRFNVPFVFVNQVGGNDELIFDGRSLVVGANGRIVNELDAFHDRLEIVDTAVEADIDRIIHDAPETNLFNALVLGLKDYVGKCGFTDVLLGLSGGIDSAMVAVLAAAALGPDHVTGLTLPGPFSSGGSVDDSVTLAKNLGVSCHTLAISDIYEQYLDVLKPLFAGTAFGIAEENIQARIRGNLLMALSNKTGAMVLNTGNKSEMAVGYCTLYGDMSGGLSVLSDVPKTWVYKLAEHVNRRGLHGTHTASEQPAKPVIPRAIIDKAPSAELRPDQRDQDSLPPYPVLDGILKYYVDDSLSMGEITAKGYDEDTVRWVIRAVDRNEYKRRQAAPGLKVTSKAFGVGRRMPVAARGEWNGPTTPADTGPAQIP